MLETIYFLYTKSYVKQPPFEDILWTTLNHYENWSDCFSLNSIQNVKPGEIDVRHYRSPRCPTDLFHITVHLLLFGVLRTLSGIILYRPQIVVSIFALPALDWFIFLPFNLDFFKVALNYIHVFLDCLGSRGWPLIKQRGRIEPLIGLRTYIGKFACFCWVIPSFFPSGIKPH